MLQFNLPVWIEQYSYSGRNFDDLTPQELNDLRQRLAALSHDKPLVSIVIPAYNEQDNLFRTLSTLSNNKTIHPVEIIVINNCSTDQTQYILDKLGVRNFMQTEQGISYAREMGLLHAKGKYHLCADADTFYPPDWIDGMVDPMIKDENVVCVYGRYSFLPLGDQSRALLLVYELFTGVLIRIRKINREFINVLGFNMGFQTEIGRKMGGFKVKQVRKFDNAAGSNYFVSEAEDGTMALNLSKAGKIKLLTSSSTRVFTSPRRLMAEGGIISSFFSRLKLHGKKMFEYVSGKSIN